MPGHLHFNLITKLATSDHRQTPPAPPLPVKNDSSLISLASRSIKISAVCVRLSIHPFLSTCSWTGLAHNSKIGWGMRMRIISELCESIAFLICAPSNYPISEQKGVPMHRHFHWVMMEGWVYIILYVCSIAHGNTHYIIIRRFVNATISAVITNLIAQYCRTYCILWPEKHAIQLVRHGIDSLHSVYSFWNNCCPFILE